jgi:hypothetical protein
MSAISHPPEIQTVGTARSARQRRCSPEVQIVLARWHRIRLADPDRHRRPPAMQRETHDRRGRNTDLAWAPRVPPAVGQAVRAL